MSDRTLGKARGLNSIADPSAFKGSRGTGTRRPRRDETDDETPTTPADPGPSSPVESEPASELPVDDESPVERAADQAPAPIATKSTKPRRRATKKAATGRPQRQRRELSVPLPVADAVDETGINPADLVLRAYRNHADEVYAGSGGRAVAKGRKRLRVSISDQEFDKITRLGEARGWNRSETVAVLLSLELLTSAYDD